MPKDLSISKLLAPEDLKEDIHVAVLSILTEHLPFSALCGDNAPWQPRGLIRTQWLPWDDVGAPLRIVRVCLPFVLVEQPDGKHRTLDTRRMKLTLLSDEYARKAGKRLRDKKVE